MNQDNKPNPQPPQIEEKNITDEIARKVKTYESLGAIHLPSDYSPENALKGAWMILQDVKDKEGKLALNSCSRNSISLALFRMATEGLNPLKSQGYFIVRGGHLKWQRSYFGTMALAKRYGKLKEIVANLIYENDNFSYEINKDTGKTAVLEHKQEFSNIDISKIKGAYATSIMEDGTVNICVMTISQIKKAWEMGDMKGKSTAHADFTDEMCKRTVINRACKSLINSSNDAAVIGGDGSEEDGHIADLNAVEIGFEEVGTQPNQTADTDVVVSEQTPKNKASITKQQDIPIDKGQTSVEANF